MDKRRGDKKSDTRLLVFNKTWLSSIKRVCWQSRRKSEHWLNQRFKQGQFNCLVMEIHIRDSVIFLLRWSIVIAICASSWLASLHLNTYVCFFTWCGIKLSTGWLGACLWGGGSVQRWMRNPRILFLQLVLHDTETRLKRPSHAKG